jgi:hypothetical protein
MKFGKLLKGAVKLAAPILIANAPQIIEAGLKVVTKKKSRPSSPD